MYHYIINKIVGLFDYKMRRQKQSIATYIFPLL